VELVLRLNEFHSIRGKIHCTADFWATILPEQKSMIHTKLTNESDVIEEACRNCMPASCKVTSFHLEFSLSHSPAVWVTLKYPSVHSLGAILRYVTTSFKTHLFMKFELVAKRKMKKLN
jgi:hypothetical protein